jgi:hypothetical protein
MNAQSTAQAISDYLLTGMHHSTPEGQAAIAAIVQAEQEQLALVKADLAALFALADIVEETDDGRPFRPNRLGGSCRSLDGAKMNELLARLKTFATS